MKYYIYKITDTKNPEEFYIGSTNNISNRRSSHKKATCNKTSKKYWLKLYQYIRANGGWTCFDVVVLEAGTCEDKTYMKQKEQEYIDKHKPTLNSAKAHKGKIVYINTDLINVPENEEN